MISLPFDCFVFVVQIWASAGCSHFFLKGSHVGFGHTSAYIKVTPYLLLYRSFQRYQFLSLYVFRTSIYDFGSYTSKNNSKSSN